MTPPELSPTKILRVIPRYAPAWQYGGSVRFSYDLDAALPSRGFNITVYTSDQIDERRRSPTRLEHLNGIEILEPEASPSPGLHSGGSRTASEFESPTAVSTTLFTTRRVW